MIVLWLALQIALVVAAVQLVDRRAWRRAVSALVLGLAMLLPFLVPLGPLPKAIMASLGVLALVKVVQVAREPGRWLPRHRLWHSLVPFDIAGARSVRPSLDRRLLLSITVHAALALLALLALILLPRVLGVPLVLMRLALGAVLVYSAMDAITESLRLLHRFAGIAVPPIQKLPILSLSIREFWSQRWNRPVSGWLEDLVFKPVSRRQGRDAGLIAAFCTSALLHAWVFLPAVGFIAAFLAGMFFVLHGFFVLVESAIRIRSRSNSVRRVWTLGLLAVSSPLFVEPVLQVLGL